MKNGEYFAYVRFLLVERISFPRSRVSFLLNVFCLTTAVRSYELPPRQILSTGINVPNPMLVDINFSSENVKKTPFEKKGCDKQGIQSKYLLSIAKSAALTRVS